MRQDLVMVSISGYGQYGTNAQRPGYDPIAQAESGFLSLNGPPEAGPTKAPTFIGDDMAGLHATIAALGALRHRDVSGEGQHVDVSLVDAMMFQNPFLTLGARARSSRVSETNFGSRRRRTCSRVATVS